MNSKQWRLIKKFIKYSLDFEDPFCISKNYFIRHFGLEKDFYHEVDKMAEREKAFLISKKDCSDEYIPNGTFLEFRKHPGK